MSKERIKKLAEQAGLWFDSELSEFWIANNLELERFAELVRNDEREACAKLCDDREQSNLYGVKECAAAIRARKNHEQV
jgi:hypothetical protein